MIYTQASHWLCFTRGSVYMLLLLSICPTLSFLQCVHKPILCVCLCLSLLIFKDPTSQKDEWWSGSPVTYLNQLKIRTRLYGCSLQCQIRRESRPGLSGGIFSKFSREGNTLKNKCWMLVVFYLKHRQTQSIIAVTQLEAQQGI